MAESSSRSASEQPLICDLIPWFEDSCLFELNWGHAPAPTEWGAIRSPIVPFFPIHSRAVWCRHRERVQKSIHARARPLRKLVGRRQSKQTSNVKDAKNLVIQMRAEPRSRSQPKQILGSAREGVRKERALCEHKEQQHLCVALALN